MICRAGVVPRSASTQDIYPPAKILGIPLLSVIIESVRAYAVVYPVLQSYPPKFYFEV